MMRLMKPVLLGLLAGLLCACSPAVTPAPSAFASPQATQAASATPGWTISPTVTPSETPAPTASATLPVIEFFEPAGCLEPPREAGEVVEVNGWQLNERTLAMLNHAQELYGGAIELTGAAVTQGSFHDNGSASFGTHMGGGAVDLSIFLPGTWQVDFGNLNRLVMALRAAGFAAWVRSIDEVYPGSGYHIHAIALGDPQLSPAAQEQLEAAHGYLRGYNGLPQEGDPPVPDVDGGPLLCGWMLEMGYSDLRDSTAALPAAPIPPADWQARLKAAAQSFETQSAEETANLAAQLYTTPEYLTWVLPGAMWEAAGLLPRGVSPADNPRNFAKLRTDAETFWGWFSPDDYEQIHSNSAPGAENWLAGDLVYLHTARGGAGQPLVVAGLDEDNRLLALLAVRAENGWRVVVNPLDEILARDWVGFDVLRYRGLGLPPGSRFDYTVQPGDTLPLIAARFGISLESLLRSNAGIPDPGLLRVGGVLIVEK